MNQHPYGHLFEHLRVQVFPGLCGGMRQFMELKVIHNGQTAKCKNGGEGW